MNLDVTLKALIRRLAGRPSADEDLTYCAAGLTVGDSGLPPEGGCVVGSKPGHVSTAIYDVNEQGVMAIGPCRSHKTAGLVVPTLLTWRGSAVISDVHGELYEQTAAWRSIDADNRIIHFAPGAPGSRDTFNLLDTIRVATEHAGRDAVHLAELLIPDDQQSAVMMLTWARAYLVRYLLIQASRKGSLSAVHAAIRDEDKRMPIDARGVDDQHPSVWEAIQEASQTLGGLQTMGAALAAVRVMASVAVAPFAAPDIAENTAASTFRIEDLVESARPASLYLVFAASDTARLEPLHRALIETITRRIIEREFPSGGHSLLLMLDNFCALGRLPFFERAAVDLRKHRIRPFVVIQNCHQLESLYGPKTHLLHFPGTIVALPPNEESSARALHALTAGKLAESALMMMGKRTAKLVTKHNAHVVDVRVPAYYTDEPFKGRSKRQGGPSQRRTAGPLR